MSDRNLTDADVRAIATELKSQLVHDFYGDVGKGVTHGLKQTILKIALVIAAYGVVHGNISVQWPK